MPFAESVPLRMASPRSDGCIVYGSFVFSASGATATASADTMAGMTVTGTNPYVLTHKTCRMRILEMSIAIPTIATASEARQVVQHSPVAGVDDAATGILNFNTIESDTAAGVAFPVDGSVLTVFGILAF